MKGVRHRHFIKFLEKIDSRRQNLLYHSHARWLSLDKAGKRVWELKGTITSFLKSIGKAEYFSELEDRDWRGDFVFTVDILTYKNKLNAKLQGKELFAHDMYKSVTAFKSKLSLFSAQIFNNSFVRFPTLLTMKEVPTNMLINIVNHEMIWTTNFAIDCLISKNYKKHFKLFRLRFHKSLQQHHKNCSWNWSIFRVTTF